MTLISDDHITNTKKERTALNRADWFFIRQDLLKIIDDMTSQSYVLNGDPDVEFSTASNSYVDAFAVVVDMAQVRDSTGKVVVEVTDVTPNPDLRLQEDGVDKGEEIGISATGLVEFDLTGLALTGRVTLMLQVRSPGGGGQSKIRLATIHHGNPSP